MTRPTDEEITDLLLEMSRRLQRASSSMKDYALEELKMQQDFGFWEEHSMVQEGIAQDIARADLAPELCKKANEMAEQLKSKEEPVLNYDGKLHEFILKSGGKSFYCHCGCNVFHKPDKNDLDRYQCNACGEQYTAED